jgi:hypothetical protein
MARNLLLPAARSEGFGGQPGCLLRCGAQAWNPSRSAGVASYNVCWGTNSGIYIYTNNFAFLTQPPPRSRYQMLPPMKSSIFAVQAVAAMGWRACFQMNKATLMDRLPASSARWRHQYQSSNRRQPARRRHHQYQRRQLHRLHQPHGRAALPRLGGQQWPSKSDHQWNRRRLARYRGLNQRLVLERMERDNQSNLDQHFVRRGHQPTGPAPGLAETWRLCPERSNVAAGWPPTPADFSISRWSCLTIMRSWPTRCSWPTPMPLIVRVL